jgi:hypothetical protein
MVKKHGFCRLLGRSRDLDAFEGTKKSPVAWSRRVTKSTDEQALQRWYE